MPTIESVLIPTTYNMRQPNLLFVFGDQHRRSDLGSYGNSRLTTRAFDRLAAEGSVFDNCVSNSPVCVPIRGSLLTGLHLWRHGAITNDIPIHPGTESIADVLNAAGYDTGYVGKWHLGGVPRERAIEPDERLGFRYWRVANCTHDYFHSYFDDEANQRSAYDGYEPIGQTDHVVDFIQDHENSDGPWACFLSWGPPHAPYTSVPEEYLARFPADSFELRPNVPDEIVHTVDRHLDREAIRTDIAGYYAHIEALDDQMDRILEALDRSNQADDTIVVYTSDHGDMLGSQGFTKKQLPYCESVCVPLIMRWPGRIPEARADGMIGLLDLPITLLGLMGLTFSGDVDGEDLSDHVLGRSEKGLDEVFIYNPIPAHQAVDRGHTRGWYGLKTPSRTFSIWDDGEPFCLYDDVSDPYQLLNYVKDTADARRGTLERELRERLAEAMSRAGVLLKSWQKFVFDCGMESLWNASQSYFGRALLEDENSPA